MGKMRRSLILLVTLLCIGFAAFLPLVTGWIQDRSILKQVGYRDSAQVQLEIQEEMTLIGKLSLLNRMEGVLEVPEALADMTAEEVEAAALAALQCYMEAGLIPEFTVWHVEARPLLILTPEEVDLAGLIWSVTILSDEEGITNVSLDMDDATGRLLRVRYNYEYWGTTNVPDALARLAEVYFTGLGLEDYKQFATDDLDDVYIGDQVGTRYCIADAAYGEVNLDLFVHRYGFSVETPFAQE